MSNELLLTFINLLNAVFCFFIVVLILWHNYNQQNHSHLIVILIFALFFLLTWFSISPNNYENLAIFVSLIIILVLINTNLQTQANIKNNSNINAENLESNDLITQAKQQERSRIYANLHDDVGAKLLELIYTAKDTESKNLAKQVLSDIRQAVASTVNIQCTVKQLVEEIIEESEMRLNSASIGLVKGISLNNPKLHLATSSPIVISRICREVISNIIKHSHASQVEISVNSNSKKMCILINDNGIGISENKKQGKGLNTIKKRAKSISSEVKWNLQSNMNEIKGTQFSLEYFYDNH